MINNTLKAYFKKICIHSEICPRYQCIKKELLTDHLWNLMEQVWWNNSIFHINHKLTCDRKGSAQPAQSVHLGALRIACLLGRCDKLGQQGGVTSSDTWGYHWVRFAVRQWHLWLFLKASRETVQFSAKKVKWEVSVTPGPCLIS